ncbi:glycosyltransferase [Advenella sp. FME57]|uniref:glycosyltransferase n=1 Tax=Advenella sp. FME57 TaxID=2742604 RepID=UPI001867454F|nr:glycosyltransferase [Advenella sp. FME57]
MNRIFQRIARVFLHSKQDVNEGLLTRASPAAENLATPVAAIIVPIRVNHQAREALVRLERLLSLIPSCFEVVVVDDGSAKRWQKEICRFAMIRPNSQYLYLPTRKRRFSLARARNSGARQSTSEIILFHDLDFLGTAETYLQIADILRDKLSPDNKQHFFCIPVAFLTEQGTKRYIRYLQSSPQSTNWAFYEEAEQGGGVKFLVQGSSCIVVYKKYFLEIGGHDESYDGHGAEDFELLHRLSSNYLIAKRPVDYSVNTGSGKIIEYRGFRAFFALYGEECVKSGCVLVHLFHPKRKESDYYQHERNFAKLKSLMSQE